MAFLEAVAGFAGAIIVVAVLFLAAAVYVNWNGRLTAVQGVSGAVKSVLSTLFTSLLPWQQRLLVGGVGWLFLLFLIWVMRPAIGGWSVWEWLRANPHLMWLPPFAGAMVELLLWVQQKKSRGIRLVAYLILAVLALSVWNALPSQWFMQFASAPAPSPAPPRTMATLVPAPSSWDDCGGEIPGAIVKKHREWVNAPAKKWSRCYWFRGNYRLSIPDETPVYIAREDGSVLSPDVPMSGVNKLRFRSRTGHDVLFTIALQHEF